MNAILYFSVVLIISIFVSIFFLLFIEIKKECEDKHYVKWKKIKEELLMFLRDYSIFGQGVGASVSGFTIVELVKDTTSVSSHELLVVFLSGIAIFEVSRRLHNRLKNN